MLYVCTLHYVCKLVSSKMTDTEFTFTLFVNMSEKIKIVHDLVTRNINLQSEYL